LRSSWCGIGVSIVAAIFETFSLVTLGDFFDVYGSSVTVGSALLLLEFPIRLDITHMWTSPLTVIETIDYSLFNSLYTWISDSSTDLILMYVSPRGTVSPVAFDIVPCYVYVQCQVSYKCPASIAIVWKSFLRLWKIRRIRWVVEWYDMGLLSFFWDSRPRWENEDQSESITCTLNLTLSAASDVPYVSPCLHFDVEDLNVLFKSFKDIQIIY
jgi:hypothetical protein